MDDRHARLYLCVRCRIQVGRMRVREAWQAEQPSLLVLPQHDFALGERVAVSVGKTPYVRFDLNDYSVPHTHVSRTLAVLADEHTDRILEDAQELARHTRCWGRGQQVEDQSHISTLIAHKRGARARRACDRLAQAVPASTELLSQAAAWGDNIGSITAALMRLLDRYGANALQELMSLDFLKQASNVVLVGPNGVGKTMCACNIGYQAVLAGHLPRPGSCSASWLRWTATRLCAGSCASTPPPMC
jgi:ATP-dependent protease Clp ATPase subunit